MDFGKVVRAVLVLLLGAAATAAPPASGERAVLDQQRREYETLRVRRDNLLAELRTSYRELDAEDAPRGDFASYLAGVASREDAVADKEAVLLGLLRRGGELRRSIAERACVVAAEGQGGAKGAVGPDLEGTWRLTFEGAARDGSLTLVQLGALLSGAYDVPGLSRGTFFGNGGNGKVVLTFIDDRGDLFAVLRGTIGGASSMSGNWIRSDLAAGQPATGNCSAGKAAAGR